MESSRQKNNQNNNDFQLLGAYSKSYGDNEATFEFDASEGQT